MLFLLNAVVVKISESVALPRGLEPLAQMTPAGVLKAGGEIYARHPRLEYDRPDIAEWYCSLLAAKHPAAGAARFRKDAGGYAGQLAAVPFPLLARLWTMQRDGLPIDDEVRRTVWEPEASRLKALLAS
ncbi:MAG: hypothetical protein JF588_16105 [Caulobacterales bacterium]|nr:hypothetical protein [Caulobacterales bacterium]